MPARDNVAYTKKWRAANPDKVKGYTRKHYLKSKNRYLLKTYGISLDEYNQMFAEQEGCCAVCGKHQSEFKKALAVDHNHETEAVRGLLCYRCNSALGMLDENPEIISNLLDYVEKHND
jgi:hypothetical protein